MDEEGNVFQMCRHCGEEFFIQAIPNGIKLQWKNGVKIAEGGKNKYAEEEK